MSIQVPLLVMSQKFGARLTFDNDLYYELCDLGHPREMTAQVYIVLEPVGSARLTFDDDLYYEFM